MQVYSQAALIIPSSGITFSQLSLLLLDYTRTHMQHLLLLP